MKGLNLSKFKKSSSNKDSTILKHEDGHTINIAHHKLSKGLKNELDNLPIYAADGVDTAPDDQSDNQVKAPQGVNININAGPQGGVSPVATLPQQNSVANIPQQDPSQNVASLSSFAPPQQAEDMPAKAIEPEQQAPVADQQASNEMPSIDTSQVPQAPVAQPTPIDPKVATKQELSSENAAFEHDLNNGHITPETYSDLFAKKSTLGKIGSIFGLMLSGAGAGLTHQPNALLAMMQNEINNDLDAQKQSKANAQNFLRLNQQNKLNEAQVGLTGQQAGLTKVEADSKAYALAQSQMLQATYHNLVQNVNKMPEGPMKEQAKQQLGFIYSKVADRINNINDQAAGATQFYNTLFGNQAGGGNSGEQSFQKQTQAMKMLGPQGEARAKDVEEKHIPGIPGQASMPLSDATRDMINSGVSFDQKLDRFIDWTKDHSGDLNPEDIKKGQALAAELQGAYRQATHGGVYKEGEQNFISNIIDSDPTKFFNKIRVLPQLEAVSSENKARVDQLVKSKGLPGYTGSVGNTQSAVNKSGQDTIERVDPKSGKTVIYDAKTKQPLRWK